MEELSAERIKAVVAELKASKDKYTGYLEELSETGNTQILTTDPDYHRMHTKDGFNCCYNVQTAVDAGSHLIAEYEVTGHNTDQGLLSAMAEKAKETLELETLEVVANKGYESREDIQKCLHAGVLPTCYENSATTVELQEENEVDCFTRNENGTVTCPMGQILHKIKDKDPGAVCASKDACRMITFSTTRFIGKMERRRKCCCVSGKTRQS